MGVGSNQPLAEGKGVYCEVESEGSRMQSFGLSNTNNIRHNQTDEFAKQNEVLLLPGVWSVNVAATRDESFYVYHGRSHGRAEVFFSEARLTIVVRSQQKS